ncbi:MAG TPA: AMED_5909 family protein [Pseudonocardiaceae bacterium]|nr:AMED_5909 family protein [Pseudonocardiaceae bacterium]
MVTDKESALGQVTLRQAHELLTLHWPGLNASVAARAAYHERAASLYEHVARVDPDHHHEALFWANEERHAAEAAGAASSQCVRGAGGE